MPLNAKAKKVLKSMKNQYGSEKGERVFYATANKQDRKPETWSKEAAAQCGAKLKKALKKRSRDEGRISDRKEFELGAKEELEHTDDPRTAVQIAKDHLNEDPDYYEKLDDAGLVETKTAGLRALLGKQAAYYQADENEDEDENEKPSLMWNMLGGAGLGAAAGAALGGGTRAVGSYVDYIRNLEPQFDLDEAVGNLENMPPPYFEKLDARRNQAGGSRLGAAWKGFTDNAWTPGLIGAGVGAGAGLLRYLLKR